MYAENVPVCEQFQTYNYCGLLILWKQFHATTFAPFNDKIRFLIGFESWPEDTNNKYLYSTSSIQYDPMTNIWPFAIA